MVSKQPGPIIIAGHTSDIGKELEILCQQNGIPTLGFSRNSPILKIDALVEKDLQILKTEIEKTNLPVTGVICLIGGMTGTGEVSELSNEDWQKTFDQNVSTVHLLTKILGPKLAPDAVWINFSSMMVKSASKYNRHYTASKSALETYGEALADEWAKNQIRILTLRLGLILTTKRKADPFFNEEAALKKAGVKELPTPAQAANFIFKMINDNQWKSGAVIEYPGKPDDK